MKLPRIYQVNWFRKDQDGAFLWPGYRENSRVLAWIFRRCQGKANAIESPIGLLPRLGEAGINTNGLAVTSETMARLLTVDIEGWKEQLPQMHEHYAQFGDRLPAELHTLLNTLDEHVHSG